MIDSIIKIFLAVLKILVDYKTAHLPETTADTQKNAQEEYEKRNQEFKRAVVVDDPVTITAMFERLRSIAMAHETGAGDSARGKSGDSAI